MLRGGTEKLSYGPWRESPLKLAALTGRLDVVEAVLRYETEVNAVDDFGETALHAAVGLSTSHDLLATRRLGEGDHVGMIGALVRAGADPNIAVASDRARFDEEDETPLYRAVGAGRVETVQALLKAGSARSNSRARCTAWTW
jgi:ankyrin repeat protein